MTTHSHYQRHIFFCTNQREKGGQCCMDHDSMTLRNYAKQRSKELGLAGAGKVRVNSAGCLDRCSEGPVCVVYPEAVWYTYKDRDDIDEIVEDHLVRGNIVSRLKI
ncbi:MAG: (2Fe-2S) ferredoxin domain-containing protein [Gammaproteobacteria bacterium]|nr:(2Fe-2S) ferredoxin domain-containing protein [Gammaproteobacteria bacterium]MDH3767718.1 (2Fe-2S) ferredoxin domain-containing protein [Gammaproteobacteria bacterium]